MQSSYFDTSKAFTGKYNLPGVDKNLPSWMDDFKPSTPSIEELKRSYGTDDKASSARDFLKSWLDRDDQNKYRGEASRQERPYFGEGFKGTGSQVLENLGALYPQQHSPVYLPGVQGEQSLFGKIAGIAAPIVGLMGGPTAPFISAGLGAASRVF